jgi:hypothetical protein
MTIRERKNPNHLRLQFNDASWQRLSAAVVDCFLDAPQ